MKTTVLCLPFLLISLEAVAALPSSSSTTASILSWQNCSSNSTLGLECTQLSVPLDWENPHGATISLHINKLPASNPKKCIGSLFVNPGGPGDSAMTIVEQMAEGTLFISPAVTERFDLIGQDPRGAGASSPVQCDPSLWNRRVSLFPNNESAYVDMLAYWKEVGESCLNKTGALLNHVDTISAVKDMEAVRVALGDGPLNYMGFSYGTQLGAQYAAIYPKNIRAMILDAVADHSDRETTFAVSELTSYEVVLNHFFKWCSQNASSPLHGKDVGRLFDDLVKQADQTPIPAPGCKATGKCRPDVTGEELRFNIQNPIIFTKAYPIIATWLAQALKGNATALSTKWYTEPTDMVFSQTAIACQDWFSSSTWPQYLNRQILLRSVAPHLKGATWTYAVEAMCQHWPAPRANPPRMYNIQNPSAPILIVNSLYDPRPVMRWPSMCRGRSKGRCC
jgi:pimeloyl-ACP methyl ester carboxylesterase